MVCDKVLFNDNIPINQDDIISFRTGQSFITASGEPEAFVFLPGMDDGNGGTLL